MIVDKSKIGLTFRHPRVSRETQEAALRADGAQWIVHVGEITPDWQDPVRQLRPGDVMRVYACVMVPAPRGELGPQAAQWTAFAKGVHERGTYIIEVSTGRKSNNPKQWRAMNLETHAAFRKGGKQLPKGIRPSGRPKKLWASPEIESAARKLWKSKNIESDAAAIREAIETWPGVTERMMRGLGPSGRNKK